MKILSMRDICKSYFLGEEEVRALIDVDLQIETGEFISVLGPSGSGKTTLMNIIGCLDVPSSGEYILNGNLIEDLDEKALSAIRNREIGFIFQQFQLLPKLSAQQNVELPLVYAGVSQRERTRRAQEMLTRVGLSDKMKNRPNQMSGGQQQRVAIARAMVTDPSILLADEPTGALDQKTGNEIMDLFCEINGEGKTVIMITHNEKIATRGKRVVHILDGLLREVPLHV